jgi:hypothetical protein
MGALFKSCFDLDLCGSIRLDNVLILTIKVGARWCLEFVS